MKNKNHNYQTNTNQNNNGRNNNNRPSKPPYVKNPDPMTTHTSRGWEGMKIMRQIARRKWNMYENGDIFRDLLFVQDTITEAQKRQTEAAYHYNAMVACYGNVDNPDIRAIIETDGMKIYAYNLIISQLGEIIRCRNTSPLLVLINQLPKFRKVL